MDACGLSRHLSNMRVMQHCTVATVGGVERTDPSGYHCRLKKPAYSRLSAYIVFTFWTLSGISPANRSQFGRNLVHMHRSRAERSRNFGHDRLSRGEMGAQKCPWRRGYFCQQYEMTFRQLCNGRFSPNLAMTRESWLKRRFWTLQKFMKSFHSGVICPQNPRLEAWRG